MSDSMQKDETVERLRAYPLQKHLDALFEKRVLTREKALLGLVDAFTRKWQLDFAEENYITLQHRMINSINRGSATEALRASHALGLLAITVGFGDKAHEIMQESIPQLSQALRSKSDSVRRSSVINCLAVVTFVGGDHAEETQRSMEIIWELINSRSGSNVAPKNKPTSDLLAVAISAWSFLLTTVGRLKIGSSNWQESISLLSNLLDSDDQAVSIAAGEAIALIFELGGFKSSLERGFECVQGLKAKILNRVTKLYAGSVSEDSTNAGLDRQQNSFKDVVAFLETGDFPETSMKIVNCSAALKISSWSEMIQLSFLRRFLGSGFLKHMQENEWLHDVFGVAKKKKCSSSANVEYLVNNEKDIHLFYLPPVKKDGAATLQRLYKSPNSFINKARTQVLSKKRMSVQVLNQGHFIPDAGES